MGIILYQVVNDRTRLISAFSATKNKYTAPFRVRYRFTLIARRKAFDWRRALVGKEMGQKLRITVPFVLQGLAWISRLGPIYAI